MISISKAEHLHSFWNRGLGELGNGLFPIYPPPRHPGKGWILPYNLHLLGNFPVSQVAGYKCTLLAGNSISPAGSEEQINISQQSPKMLKMALEIFIHALLLFLGLFLKSFRWVPPNIDFPWTPSLKNTLKLPESLERSEQPHKTDNTVKTRK